MGYFGAKFVAPSISPNQLNQPGFATLQYREAKGGVQALGKPKLTFLKLHTTLGLPANTKPNDLEYFHVDLEKKFGLSELSVAHIKMMEQRLLADPDLAFEWI